MLGEFHRLIGRHINSFPFSICDWKITQFIMDMGGAALTGDADNAKEAAAVA